MTPAHASPPVTRHARFNTKKLLPFSDRFYSRAGISLRDTRLRYPAIHSVKYPPRANGQSPGPGLPTRYQSHAAHELWRAPIRHPRRLNEAVRRSNEFAKVRVGQLRHLSPSMRKKRKRSACRENFHKNRYLHSVAIRTIRCIQSTTHTIF